MLRFTTHQGLEDIVINEVQSICARNGITPGEFESAPFGVRGNVLYRHVAPAKGRQVSEDRLVELVRSIRSAYHIVRYLAHIEYESEDFYDELPGFFEELEVPDLESAGSFRVRCDRRGDRRSGATGEGNHAFRSPDVERLAGSILQRRYGTAVKLEEPACDVRIDIFGAHLFAGVRLSEEHGDRRFVKAFHQRVATRSVVAYSMLNLAGVLSKPGDLIDPFCGSGTILLEAADLLPEIRLYGCDIHEDAVEGTRANLERLGAAERASVVRGDARHMTELFPPESADYIITDPPLGVKMGKRTNYYALYRSLLEEAKAVLRPGGRLLLLSFKHRKLLNYAVRDSGGYKILHVRVIEYGGIFPALFLLQKICTEHEN